MKPNANRETKLKDRWVLITGASSGFGAAAALAFAAEGSRLLLGARRTDRLEQVAAQARTLGATAAHFHQLDVAQTGSVQPFVAWVEKVIKDGDSGGRRTDGKLDILINNAGGAHGLDTVAEGKDED